MAFLQIHNFGSVDLDKAELGLRGLGGREELSRLFLFRLYLDFPEDKQDELSADKFMGQRIVFTVGESIFSGIVRRFAFGDIDPEKRRDCWAEVVPELWKLSEMLDSRRYDSKTVATLVEDMVKDKKLDLKFVDKTSTHDDMHPPRSNPVQHDETCLNFIARLMDEESIFYYFHEDYEFKDDKPDGNQTFVIGDGTEDYHVGEEVLKLSFQPEGQGRENMTSVESWQRQFNYQPASWTVQDYDFHKSADFNMAKTTDPDEKNPFRKFKSGAGFYDKDYGDRLLERLTERENVSREYITASSDCPLLFPGMKFELTGHPVESENGMYVVTSVQHQATEYPFGETAGHLYENSFACVPDGRIAVETPESSIPPSSSVGMSADFEWEGVFGPSQSLGAAWSDSSVRTGAVPGFARSANALGVVCETATVVDEHGHDTLNTRGFVKIKPPTTNNPSGVTDTTGYGDVMVQVRFSWENGPGVTGNGKPAWTAGRWIRVSQPVASGAGGMKFVPRVGDEVVVLYMNGDEKRPVIVGSLYNNAQKISTEQNQMDFVVIGPNPEFSNYKTKSPTLSKDNNDYHQLAKTDETETLDVASIKDSDVSGIVTRSHGTDANDQPATKANELLFRDTWDNEEIYIHAARDLNIKVERDMNIDVGGNKSEIIRANTWTTVNVGPKPNVNSPAFQDQQSTVTTGDSVNNLKSGKKPTLRGALASEFAYGSNTGVTQGVVDGVSFDVDKVIGSKVVENVAVDGTNLVWRVKEETWANTESRTVGNDKDTRIGNTESHQHGDSESEQHGDDESKLYGHSASYQYTGNSFSYLGGASESIVLGGDLSIFVGLHVGIEVAIAFDFNFSPFKFEWNAGFRYEKNAMGRNLRAPIHLRTSEVDKVESAVAFEDVDLSVKKSKVHRIESDIIMLKGKLIMIDANVVKVNGNNIDEGDQEIMVMNPLFTG